MDFIERWFHISPDGGNGSLEALYIVVIAALIMMVLFRRQLGAALARYAQRPAKRDDGDRAH